jgi:hypothetical protein
VDYNEVQGSARAFAISVRAAALLVRLVPAAAAVLNETHGSGEAVRGRRARSLALPDNVSVRAQRARVGPLADVDDDADLVPAERPGWVQWAEDL